MSFLRGFLRVYSWIFETVLCALAIGVAIVSQLSGSQLQIGWLPWSGRTLLAWMIALGLLGLICVVLAVFGRFRFLLFLFSIGAFVLLIKGFFASGYSFPEPDRWKGALLLLAGALLAIAGAWPAGSSPRSRDGRRGL